MLDSNLVIPYLADDPATVPLVERLAPRGIAISIITYLEVYQGTLRSPNPHLALEQFEHFLAVVPTLPLSPAVARRCARLRESLKGRGRRVRHRALDLVIAATALEHGLQLVTRNLADYEDIPELALHTPS
ncbi:MAG: type II toxin-antitoxin system VapC family toxin [Chloroflexota bacterium]|nr:type II toxin-antitoxin system VapC family toxin [Chloroflexota bacterium]